MDCLHIAEFCSILLVALVISVRLIRLKDQPRQVFVGRYWYLMLLFLGGALGNTNINVVSVLTIGPTDVLQINQV